MIKVYIASPYSSGNKETNVQLQIDAAYHLLKMGFNPYMPLYNHFIQEKYPDLADNINWLEHDLEWLNTSDIMIRLHPKDENGVEIKSIGADIEERFCNENHIPVFHYDTIEEMCVGVQTFIKS